MPYKLGEYDHLNEDDKIRIEMDFDELAQKIVAKNYEVDRIMSSLVKALNHNAKKPALPSKDANTVAIWQMPPKKLLKNSKPKTINGFLF
jgi:hypothetical protein